MVRSRLEQERDLGALPAALPSFPLGTRAKQIADSITALTNVDEIRRLATLSEADEARLQELRQAKADSQASSPLKLSLDISLKANRLSSVATHLEELESIWNVERVNALRAAHQRLSQAHADTDTLIRESLTADLMAGTGEPQWHELWQAAAAFWSRSRPGATFPPELNEQCPFCQQPLGTDAATRMQRLHNFLVSQVHQELVAAREQFDTVTAVLLGYPGTLSQLTAATDELAVDDPSLSERVKTYFTDADERHALALSVSGHSALPDIEAIGESPLPAVAERIRELKARANALRQTDKRFDEVSTSELAELESRVLLRDARAAIEVEIERKKRYSAFGECIQTTNTQQITRKSKELTERLITEQLKKRLLSN